MILKTNLIGEHNGQQFALVDGLLHIYGARMSLHGVKSIIEIVTLLKAQGYEIREKFPRKKPMSILDQMSGKPIEYYDDNEEPEEIL